jgi:hypothetical protein
VGAGASFEANLPVGEKLKETIAKKLDLRFEHFSKMVGAGDLRIFDLLRRKHPQAINDYLHACWTVRDGVVLSSSIDDFIDTHRADDKISGCGKLGIAVSIAEAERASLLWVKPGNIYNTINFDGLTSTWYPQLLSMARQRRSTR